MKPRKFNTIPVSVSLSGDDLAILAYFPLLVGLRSAAHPHLFDTTSRCRVGKPLSGDDLATLAYFALHPGLRGVARR